MPDVTDATFQRDVLDRSAEVPVVVDLWAEWCGPCRTLGPILERVVGETAGKVELAKVDVDSNPGVSAAFAVQSIPAVFAIADGKVVDSFVGALPEASVREFVSRLAPAESEADRLAARGDEASLRQALELQHDHPAAVVALAELLAERGEGEDALALLTRIPDSAESRRVAALARLGEVGTDPDTDVEPRLQDLLDRVKDDETARREYVDLLEMLGPDDPRTPQYRRALASRLY
ncbi:MAG TPA: tetratricopeptide repeat protein [Acidimicrobiales bacterium]|jgi:putative thioredoxin|nr:tetratricopeptide repeat protein [Acidimicrobiales bacterium]